MVAARLHHRSKNMEKYTAAYIVVIDIAVFSPEDVVEDACQGRESKVSLLEGRLA